MLKLVVRRLLSAIAVLFVVSLITFVVLLCIPGDPAQLILGVEATPEKVEALRASMGLDRPWYVQYMHWIQGVLTGNWGTSYLYGENVWTLICQRLPVTFSVALLSMAAALVVSAILGILAALKKGSPMDLLSRTVMQIGGAVPSFWLAMLFMLLFSSYLGWFPVTGYTAPGENFGAFLKCIALPSLVLAIGELGILIRIVRSSMLTALQQDFMMSANVKGLPPARAIVHYALRSAIIAPITISGMQLAKLLGGTVIVETIFCSAGHWPSDADCRGAAGHHSFAGNRALFYLWGGLVSLVIMGFGADLAVMAANPTIRTGEGDRTGMKKNRAYLSGQVLSWRPASQLYVSFRFSGCLQIQKRWIH